MAMSDFITKTGMGWLPDYPDHRDYTMDHKEIKSMVKKIGVTEPLKMSIPNAKDLRTWCPPIENQYTLGFCYAFAQNYQAIKYFRLDPLLTPKDVLLKRIKALIAYGLPAMFGFTVFNSINQSGDDGKIPSPCPGEKIAGGHAVVAVGYDDQLAIHNTICGTDTTGALLIRNPWGTQWGDNGYGWLPYDYVLKGLAIDWWTLLKGEWVDTGQFRL